MRPESRGAAGRSGGGAPMVDRSMGTVDGGSVRMLVLIPDGVGIRNLVLTGVIAELQRIGRVDAFHDVPPERLGVYAAESGADVAWHVLLESRETPLSSLLRYSLDYAQMYWADTQSMRFRRSASIAGSWRRRVLHRAARVAGRLAGSPRGVRLLGRCHSLLASRGENVREYRRLLNSISPSILVCSHQRPPSIIGPVLAARSLGIPTATFIFSWDNLTSKGRIAAPFDHYFVWSDQMRRELRRYYPDVEDDRIHVVGAPQFEPYSDASLLWSRVEFCQKIGADPKRPLICYSGGDTGTCPEDPLHVGVLMDLVRRGRVPGNPQVLLRPAPVDDGSRYDDVRRQYPEIVYLPPAWVHARPGDWASVIPLPEDVRLLSNLTYHADVNVNMASTMTLDFALRDRPVVNIAFDVGNPPPFGIPLWEFFYRFEHYRPVVEMGAVRCARSPEELADHLNAYLDDPSLDSDARRRLVEFEVGVPVGQAKGHIVEAIRTIAREK